MKFSILLLSFAVFVSASIQRQGGKNKDENKVKQGLRTVSKSNLHFSSNFFKAVSNDQQKNLVCSPLSAQMTLSLARLGAKGKTGQQISHAMNLNSQNQKRNIQDLKTFMTELRGQNKNGTQLKLVNWIYIREGFELQPRFENQVNKAFKVKPDVVDFTIPDTAERINDQVARYTKGKIKNLISPDSFDGNTAAVLINALYFKGKWEKAFTVLDKFDFHSPGEPTISTKFLKTKSTLRVEDFPHLKATAVQIPYQTEKISLVIILPHVGNTLVNLENHLNSDKLGKTLDTLSMSEPKTNVVVFMPKFTMETTLELNEPLKKMGMTDMFNPEKADFSGLIKSHHGLWVSKSTQKTFIEISEQGTEAASATAIQIQSRMFVENTIFKADKPFLFYIILKSPDVSPIILFSGRFVKPQ